MLFGLGHSNFTEHEFIDICKEANVDLIIDSRSHPVSSAHPQHNIDEMKRWLPAAGVGYEWWPEIGGWREKHANLTKLFKEFDVDVTAYCGGLFPKHRIGRAKKLAEGEHGFTNYGFHDYSYYMSLPEFIDGVNRLLVSTNDVRAAVICCEAAWWKCHRSLIADYLIWRGESFTHLLPRFRKIKLPRTVVGEKPHSDVISDRLSRFSDFVKSSWVRSQ